jgi:hypothetical protein
MKDLFKGKEGTKKFKLFFTISYAAIYLILKAMMRLKRELKLKEVKNVKF